MEENLLLLPALTGTVRRYLKHLLEKNPVTACSLRPCVAAVRAQNLRFGLKDTTDHALIAAAAR